MMRVEEKVALSISVTMALLLAGLALWAAVTAVVGSGSCDGPSYPLALGLWFLLAMGVPSAGLVLVYVALDRHWRYPWLWGILAVVLLMYWLVFLGQFFTTTTYGFQDNDCWGWL